MRAAKAGCLIHSGAAIASGSRMERMRRLLERHGYRTYAVVSGVEALTFWHKHRDDNDLLVTDVVMAEGKTSQAGRSAAHRKTGLEDYLLQRFR